MGQQGRIAVEPEFETCRYGRSPLRFRAQLPVCGRADCAVLGSGLSFGRFAPRPWPEQLAELTGTQVCNLAVPQTGPEAWLADEELMVRAACSSLQVVEVPGCQRLSNRFYQVHPRRNDRVVHVSAALKALYPDVDFAEYLFTGHLLRSLLAQCPRRFREVEQALLRAWTDRMRVLLAELPGPVLLLWLRPRPGGARPDPVALSALQLQGLQADVRGILELRYDPGGLPGSVAGCFPSVESHTDIAFSLAPFLMTT